MFLALAGGLSGGIATVAQGIAVAVLLVRLVDGDPTTHWQPAAWWLVALLVVRAVASYAVDTGTARAAATITLQLRRRILATVLETGSTTSTGRLTLLATRGLAAIEPYVTRYLPSLLLAAVLPVLTVATITYLDWLSGLIVIATLPLVPVFAILIGLVTRDKADQQWRTLSMLSGHFLDVMRGLPTLVSFGRAKAQVSTIRGITQRYRQATVETLKVAFMSSAALELIATLSVALVAVSVGLRLRADSLDFETAMIVLLLAPEAYWPLRRVGAEFHAAAEGVAAFADVEEVLASLEHDQTVTAQRAQPAGAVELRGVEHRYQGRTTPALAAVRATIPARGLTAIVGPSGCGKSTLLLVLAGELPAEPGTVLVGGQDLSTVDLETWRGRFAWGSQEPWLLPGALRESLLLAAPHATDEELWAALDKVALAQTVRRLPQGLDTPLGEDGAGLSAGQRARLALARVVLADRPFVFLDEPTAHLDEETEAVLLRTLTDLARDRAVVVVAHRSAVIDAADQTVTLGAPAVTAVPAHESVPAPERVVPRADASSPDVGNPRRRLALGTALGSLSLGCGVALTATAGWLITRASEHPPILYLMVAIVGVRTFGIGRPVLRYAERVVSHDAALGLLADRRARVFEALVPLVPGALPRRRGDILASVVDDVDSLVDRQLRVRQPVQTALVVSLAAALFAGWKSPVAGLTVLGVAGLGVAAWMISRLASARAERAFIAARADLSDLVERTARDRQQLRLWRAGSATLRSLDQVGGALGAAASTAAGGVAIARGLALVAGGAGTLLAAATIPAGSVAPATHALLVLLPLALVDAIAPLADAGALSVRTASAQQRLDAIVGARPRVTESPNAIPATGIVSSYSLRDVTAGWGDSPAFEGLDLSIPSGERHALVGPSGSGKSTLAALLLRFLDPTTGSVRADDHDIRSLTLESARDCAALVDDRPHVFASTVAENVRLARPDATDDEVHAALEQAHLGSWITTLPHGVATFIGEGHAEVSGGERARLAIARAMLSRREVLVLDEPTAHLDRESADRIATEVLQPGRTVLWITHGESGLDLVDRVTTLA